MTRRQNGILVKVVTRGKLRRREPDRVEARLRRGAASSVRMMTAPNSSLRFTTDAALNPPRRRE